MQNLFNGAYMSNTLHKSMVHLGAKIPAALSERIDSLAPYYKGGKSEIVRRAIAEGLQLVVNDHLVNFPTTSKKKYEH